MRVREVGETKDAMPRALSWRNIATISEKQRMFLSCPDWLAEGARFENPDAIETIGRDLLSSVRIQSLTEESEADETPMKPVRAR
jgi:hypothetical protein